LSILEDEEHELQGSVIEASITSDPIVFDLAFTQTPQCDETLQFVPLWDGYVVTGDWIVQTESGFILTPTID
jgi:hypothetical protein